MNKILKTFAFTLGIVAITNGAFSMESREAADNSSAHAPEDVCSICGEPITREEIRNISRQTLKVGTLIGISLACYYMYLVHRVHSICPYSVSPEECTDQATLHELEALFWLLTTGAMSIVGLKL